MTTEIVLFLPSRASAPILVSTSAPVLSASLAAKIMSSSKGGSGGYASLLNLEEQFTFYSSCKRYLRGLKY